MEYRRRNTTRSTTSIASTIVMPVLGAFALALVGFASTNAMSTANTTVQTTAEDHIRGRVMAVLAELPVTVWPSEANFVLFRPEQKNAEQVWQELVDRSVLVRNCSAWPRESTRRTPTPIRRTGRLPREKATASRSA